MLKLRHPRDFRCYKYSKYISGRWFLSPIHYPALRFCLIMFERTSGGFTTGSDGISSTFSESSAIFFSEKKKMYMVGVYIYIYKEADRQSWLISVYIYIQMYVYIDIHTYTYDVLN